MRCPRCDVELVQGTAIWPGHPEGCFNTRTVITKDNLEIINCLKCPKCGYSDDGIIPRGLEGIENHNLRNDHGN